MRNSRSQLPTMFNTIDTLLIFAVLTPFLLLGGAAIGAGIRGRRWLPVVWGVLIGGAPLYLGIERATKLGDWLPLAWQAACLGAAALVVGLSVPRLRNLILRRGSTTLMIGTLIMAAAALLAAWIDRGGSEIVSLIVGGTGFLFGAMWFGAGVQQLRGKDA